MTIEFKQKAKNIIKTEKVKPAKQAFGLSIDREVVEWAKKYAKENNTFTSSVVQVALERLRTEMEGEVR